jgi:hypothetical protein
MEKLTIEQAYLAMYYFLDDLYERTHSDDLGGFLGGFRLLNDGKPADPAAWSDWMTATNKVLSQQHIK